MRETRLEQQDERTYQEGGGSLGTDAEASGGITEAEHSRATFGVSWPIQLTRIPAFYMTPL